jgi:hypothetical protein
MNDVAARKARRRRGWPAGPWSWAEELLAAAAAEQEDEPVQVLAKLGQAVGGVAGELFAGRRPGGRRRGPAIG